MSAGRFKYTMLIASLPQLPADLFAAQQPPISRIQLDRRLSLLDENDTVDLMRAEQLLHWHKIREIEEDKVIDHYLAEATLLNHGFLSEIVASRLEIRTILTALRSRLAGDKTLDGSQFHGFGDLVRQIRRHWRDKALGLGQRMPWIDLARQLLEEGDSLELERLILGIIWQQYVRMAAEHYFDFPAVVLYVLRWDIINRWCIYDSEQALMHFDELVSTGLTSVDIEYA